MRLNLIKQYFVLRFEILEGILKILLVILIEGVINHFVVLFQTIENRLADVLDGTRPYSFCEPSESDPLYASVGVPGVFASPRNRPEGLFQYEMNLSSFVLHISASTSTAVAVAANSIVPPPAKKLDFWSAIDCEGSGGSMALPYYSSIHHDPNRASPVYQEAPTISNGQSPVRIPMFFHLILLVNLSKLLF